MKEADPALAGRAAAYLGDDHGVTDRHRHAESVPWPVDCGKHPGPSRAPVPPRSTTYSRERHGWFSMATHV
jgi:hypothetical protein